MSGQPPHKSIRHFSHMLIHWNTPICEAFGPGPAAIYPFYHPPPRGGASRTRITPTSAEAPSDRGAGDIFSNLIALDESFLREVPSDFWLQSSPPPPPTLPTISLPLLPQTPQSPVHHPKPLRPIVPAWVRYYVEDPETSSSSSSPPPPHPTVHAPTWTPFAHAVANNAGSSLPNPDSTPRDTSCYVASVSASSNFRDPLAAYGPPWVQQPPQPLRETTVPSFQPLPNEGCPPPSIKRVSRPRPHAHQNRAQPYARDPETRSALRAKNRRRDSS
ncbi:hypothetical protein C8Q77DRAFT_1075312 [Trametes polyzona]|nr:hypothetical protein C8Q77DRAFT_1075312 [Trametes polyzona]